MKRNRGFTLIEILIVIALMAILSVMAISGSITIQRYFAFSATYNSVLNQIQEARLYAATQQAALNPATSMNAVPLNYGVELLGTTTPNGLLVYAEFGGVAGKYDISPPEIDTKVDEYSYDSTTYDMTVFLAMESTPPTTTNSINLTYFPQGSAAEDYNGRYFKANTITDTITELVTDDYVIIRVNHNTKKDLYKCIVILVSSGMIEPMEKDSPLEDKAQCPIPT